MSTRSNITVVLLPEDRGKQLVFDPALVRHPFIVPAEHAAYYRDAFLYKDMASFTVPSIFSPSKPGSALCSYCQSDGYLDGVGATLLEDFPDYRSALNLVLLGDAECIMAVTDVKTTPAGYSQGVLPSPRRHPEHFPHVECSDNDSERDFDGAFHYLFEDGRWKVRTKDVNTYFKDIMEDYPEIHIPLFPVTKSGWTDLRKALDRYRKHCICFRVVSDSESAEQFERSFRTLDGADAWAQDVVHLHDGKPYRVIAHVDAEPDGQTLNTYENHPNPCDADFPLKLVYITPADERRPSRTVTVDDGGGKGYNRVTAGKALLRLLSGINGIPYADWDDARAKTAGIDHYAQVLPERVLHPLLSVPAVDFYQRLTYTLAPLSEQTEELRIDTFLADHEADFSDVYTWAGGKVTVSVEDGDWKHSHRYLDTLMGYLGYEKTDENVTEEDGSDCYSSEHTFRKYNDIPADSLPAMN